MNASLDLEMSDGRDSNKIYDMFKFEFGEFEMMSNLLGYTLNFHFQGKFNKNPSRNVVVIFINDEMIQFIDYIDCNYIQVLLTRSLYDKVKDKVGAKLRSEDDYYYHTKLPLNLFREFFLDLINRI